MQRWVSYSTISTKIIISPISLLLCPFTQTTAWSSSPPMLLRPLSPYRVYGKKFYSYSYLHPVCGTGVPRLNPPYCPILHYTVLYCFLCYPILSYPTLPYPTLPYPILPYPTLPYPTLPYPTISISSYFSFCLSFSSYISVTRSISLPLFLFQDMWSMRADRRKGFRTCHRVSANLRYAVGCPFAPTLAPWLLPPSVYSCLHVPVSLVLSPLMSLLHTIYCFI